jgi:hypothetical protein
MTAEYKKFGKDHEIRLSGRPSKKEAADLALKPTEHQDLFKSDLRKRSVIEGRIGMSKRKYRLDEIVAPE